jgi:hypothetical protein
MIITCALYGVKSSGASWRAMFQYTIINVFGFDDTSVDPDVYRRKNRKPNGEEYYELLLVYVDDCLVVSHDPGAVMKKLGEYYELKEGSVKPPEIYLGANIEKVQLKNGQTVWCMSSNSYVKAAVDNVNGML